MQVEPMNPFLCPELLPARRGWLLMTWTQQGVAVSRWLRLRQELPGTLLSA
jgi:hypothetical protein